MRYLLTLFRDENALPDRTDLSAEQRQAALRPYIAFSEWCQSNEVTILAGDALAPAETATMLTHGDGSQRITTDGPYLELKDQIGGFYLIDCAHADLALAAAGQVPFLGACELRPILDYGV